MKNTHYLALAILVLAAASSFAADAGKPTKVAPEARSARPVKLVDIDAEAQNRKSLHFAVASQSDCKCSEWKKVTVEECVAWDTNGNCAKTELVTKKVCVAWDHCH